MIIELDQKIVENLKKKNVSNITVELEGCTA